MLHKVDGLFTSKYGITLARSCTYCTRIIYQADRKDKGRFEHKDTLKPKKFSEKQFTLNEMYCSKDCRDLHNDEKTVQKRIRDWERLRIFHAKAKVERLLKQQKQNDKKGSVTVTEKVR